MSQPDVDKLCALVDDFARWVDHHMKFERDPDSRPSYAMFELTKVMFRYREMTRGAQSLERIVLDLKAEANVSES